jgi:hypothetical protein
MRRLVVAILAVALSVESCLGWSEGGHHLICVMAFDLLTREQQRELFDVLKEHPRYVEDFKIPEKA